MVVILFQGTLNFSEMEVWRVGIDTLRKMHEKKTVVREESTQNDALLAIFFFVPRSRDVNLVLYFSP